MTSRRGLGFTGLLRLAVLAALVALAAVSWYYAGQILGPDALPPGALADPAATLGRTVAEVTLAAPDGPRPAWRIEPDSASTATPGADWLVFVHGRGDTRAQSLPVTPFFLREGWTVLAISYRGDPGTPGPRDYRMGAIEWRDLEAAVRYTREQGARRVVVMGISMGGGIALQFLRRSELARAVDGVVLEAPVLRWRPVFDAAARNRNLPDFLTALAMPVAARRGGFRWEELDQLAHASEFRTPMLVLHGTADRLVPLAGSERLAEHRRDLVTLVRVLDAAHAGCRETDPIGYEAAIASWLGRRFASGGPIDSPIPRITPGPR